MSTQNNNIKRVRIEFYIGLSGCKLPELNEEYFKIKPVEKHEIAKHLPAQDVMRIENLFSGTFEGPQEEYKKLFEVRDVNERYNIFPYVVTKREELP